MYYDTMPKDRMTLWVNDRRIENFLSYRVESDLYTADDAFSAELAQPETDIEAGMRCQLYINDQLALTGIIDSVRRRYDKRDGYRVDIAGRDMMGLLVDSCCTIFQTVEGKKLSELAELLLADVPYIDRKKIIYQDDVVGKLAGTRKAQETDSLLEVLDVPQKFTQIEPGMTIFEVLKTYSLSRGMMFFALPDGTLVFGRPKAKGDPIYRLKTNKTDPYENNVVSADYDYDITSRYSHVIVVGQAQGQDSDGSDTSKIQTSATVTDETMPFRKPLVTTSNNDEMSPAMYARMLMEKAKHESIKITYTVPGHTQGGRAWSVNELCEVDDDVLGLRGVYLVYARTLSMDKRNGTTTEIRLGPPGIVA